VKGFVSIDESQIGINAVPEIGPMGISFGGGQDHMFEAEITWVDIDLPLPRRSRIFLFETIGPLFNLREQGPGNERLEGDEAAEEILSHLLGIIVREVKGEDFAHKIDLPVGHPKVHHSFLKNSFL
jgi:hypothetical protein